MTIKTNTLMRTLSLLIIVALAFSSCKKKEGCTDPTATNFDPDAEEDCCCEYDQSYNIPSVYNFTPAVYTGQTVRLLLLGDLINEVKSGTATAASLNAIYQNTNALYSDIGTNKNLEGKVATQEVKDTVQSWFTQIESMGGSYLRPDSVDLSQMIEKTLMGAVFYDQAVNNYLDLVLTDDNSNVDPNKGTDMQHHWDEAFGYFGAAKDYNSYTDAEIKSPGERDSDGAPSPYSCCGNIDPTSEKCFYYAQTAAKRDIGTAGLSASSQTDYTKVIFDAWLKGRAAIDNSDYQTRDEQITIIEENWDAIIAATVVHYINDLTNDINTGASRTKHWAEAKAYLHMIGYNPNNKLGAADFNTIDNYLGANPYDNPNLLADIATARDILETKYGFTTEQAANW